MVTNGEFYPSFLLILVSIIFLIGKRKESLNLRDFDNCEEKMTSIIFILNYVKLLAQENDSQFLINQNYGDKKMVKMNHGNRDFPSTDFINKFSLSCQE